MRASQKGITLICSFEGYSSKAYKCPAGIPTIGFCTIKYPNGTPVKMGDTCTNAQALLWLEFEVNEKSAYLNQIIGHANLELNQNEYDAIVSITYNCGSGILKEGRTFGDAIRSKNKQKIADSFLPYCKITKFGIKVTSKGLLNRREAERKLFLTPII
jgi:lysozyme